MDLELDIIEQVKTLGYQVSTEKSENEDNKPVFPNLVFKEVTNNVVGSTFDYFARFYQLSYRIDIFTKDGDITAKSQAKQIYPNIDNIMYTMGFERTDKNEETMESKVYKISLTYNGYIDKKTNIIYRNYNLV